MVDNIFIRYETSSLVGLNILQLSFGVVPISDALYDFSEVLTECQIVSVSREAKIRTGIKVHAADEVSCLFVVCPILEIKSLWMNTILKRP